MHLICMSLTRQIQWRVHKHNMTAKQQAEKVQHELKIRFKGNLNVSIAPDAYIESAKTIDIVEVNSSLTIGNESIFWGKNSSINSLGAGKLTIGKRTTIGVNNKIYCRDSITIGSHVMTAWDVTIYDYDPHPTDPELRKKQVDYMTGKFNPLSDMNKTGLNQNEIAFFDSYWEFFANFAHAPVTIGDNVWIGFGVSIFKGVTIGDNCVIAAHSVVTRDIPANSIAAGIPAKVVKTI